MTYKTNRSRFEIRKEKKYLYLCIFFILIIIIIDYHIVMKITVKHHHHYYIIIVYVDVIAHVCWTCTAKDLARLANACCAHSEECVKNVVCSLDYIFCNIWGYMLTGGPLREDIYVLHFVIIIKSEVRTLSLCLGLGHETKVQMYVLQHFYWNCSWLVIPNTI